MKRLRDDDLIFERYAARLVENDEVKSAEYLRNLKTLAVEQMQIAIRDIPEEGGYPESASIYEDFISEIERATEPAGVIDVLMQSGFLPDVINKIQQSARTLR